MTIDKSGAGTVKTKVEAVIVNIILAMTVEWGRERKYVVTSAHMCTAADMCTVPVYIYLIPTRGKAI